MKKRILLVLTALTAVFLMGFSTVSAASAEETEPAVIETETEEGGGSATEEGDFSQYFKDNILPLLVGSGSSILVTVGMLIPYLKSKGKLKTLAAEFDSVRQVATYYKKAMEAINPTALTENITAALKGIVAEMFNGFKEEILKGLALDSETLAKIFGKLEVLFGIAKALGGAAMLAWKEVEGAIAILSEAPTESAVHTLAYKTQLLESKIRELTNEKAEAIIAGVEEQTEKAVREL